MRTLREEISSHIVGGLSNAKIRSINTLQKTLGAELPLDRVLDSETVKSAEAFFTLFLEIPKNKMTDLRKCVGRSLMLVLQNYKEPVVSANGESNGNGKADHNGTNGSHEEVEYVYGE